MAIGVSDYAASLGGTAGGGDAGIAATGGGAVTLDTASSLLRARALTGTILKFPVGASETTIPVESTAGLTPDGAVVVDGECITYTGLTETSLTGCVRGAFQVDGYGPPAAHEIGAAVTQEPLPANVRVLVDAVLALQARVERLLVAVNVNAQTGTEYTLTASDHGRLVSCSNGSAIAVTVAAGLPAGFRCRIAQGGAGRVTVSGASGVTVSNRQSQTKTAGQHGVVELLQTAANAYLLIGDTGA